MTPIEVLLRALHDCQQQWDAARARIAELEAQVAALEDANVEA